MDNKKIKHLLGLARLSVTSEELDRIQTQLTDTLEAVKTMEQLDTDDTEETDQVTGLENVTREDDVCTSLTQENALANAAETHNGFFLVPSVFEDKSHHET